MNFLGFLISKSKKKEELIYPTEIGGDIKSLEYQIFREEEKLATIPKTLYERLTQISAKIIPIEPDEKTCEKMNEEIEFAHLNVTPRGVFSFTLLITLIFVLFISLLLILGYVSLIFGLLLFASAGAFVYYLYTYPSRLRKIFELRAASEMVMLILHIVIFMRNFPNLEGAVKFASSKLTGPLALDMKKILWDLYIGKYESMEQALLSYSQKWKKNFRAFADSINAIIYSLYTGGERRIELLNESIDIILGSLNEKSNSYVNQLRTPVTMVNAMGILLPTLVLTMLPILTIFLGSDIPPTVIFGFYDLVLPLALIFIIKNILDQRVVTLPEPDISLHPDLPPENKFKLGEYFISAYLPSILFFIPFLYYSYINLADFTIWKSFVIIIGAFFSLAVFFYLGSFQKIKLRKEVMEIEDEFRQVLFGLGQELDRGVPIEISMEKILPTLKGHYAINFVQNILINIKYRNLTLERSLFDKRQGAILRTPSRLVYSIMKAVVEAAHKGTKIVSEIVLSTAKYLNNLHKTQEEIKNKFSEVIGSMQMQAKILLPLITGVMNTLTYVIIQMLEVIESVFGSINAGGSASQYTFFLKMWEGLNISPSTFQLAIGIYTLETVLILSWFINGINVGVDKISLYDTCYKNLIVGCILYITVSVISLIIFGPFVDMVKIGMGHS